MINYVIKGNSKLIWYFLRSTGGKRILSTKKIDTEYIYIYILYENRKGILYEM